MKKTCLTLCVLLVGVGLYAQADSILFRIGEKTISKADAMQTLVKTSNAKKEISIDEFNNILNYHLSIYDFKARKADTTRKFKRKLESQFITVLGSVYGAKNYEELLSQCSVTQKSFAVVKDLFVPFVPMLLRDINKMQNENASFEQLVSYAATYEGGQQNTRIITPLESSYEMKKIACDLLGQGGGFVGPIKGFKGYHYLKLEREQKNFGKYKAQVIYVSDLEGSGKAKIDKAYKALKSGVPFDIVVREFSQGLRDKEDKGIRYFAPAVNTNSLIQEELEKLTKNGAVSQPFHASGAWYLLKRLGRSEYPEVSQIEKQHARATIKPSFFINELKKRYKVKEHPYNFLAGTNNILFLVDTTAYYVKDLEAYAADYGYNFTTETYDHFLHHLLLNKYREELDSERYQRLIDDFYFMQIYNPMLSFGKENNKDSFRDNLRKLVKKYKPEILNKKYVQNNPVFEK